MRCAERACLSSNAVVSSGLLLATRRSHVRAGRRIVARPALLLPRRDCSIAGPLQVVEFAHHHNARRDPAPRH